MSKCCKHLSAFFASASASAFASALISQIHFFFKFICSWFGLRSCISIPFPFFAMKTLIARSPQFSIFDSARFKTIFLLRYILKQFSCIIFFRESMCCSKLHPPFSIAPSICLPPLRKFRENKLNRRLLQIT